MLYHITLTIPVKGLGSTMDALETAASMIEHLAETFNDDESLQTDDIRIKIADERGKPCKIS